MFVASCEVCAELFMFRKEFTKHKLSHPKQEEDKEDLELDNGSHY